MENKEKYQQRFAGLRMLFQRFARKNVFLQEEFSLCEVPVNALTLTHNNPSEVSGQKKQTQR